MAFVTHPVVQGLRRSLRGMGLTRPLANLLAGSGYEEKFDGAMMATVTDANLVWDVGANVGIYTMKFAEALASEGRVVAFEPSPRNADALLEMFQADDRVTVQKCALSDRGGNMYFEAASEGNGTTDRIVDYDTGLKVEVVKADTLVFERGLAAPDFVKIDVEGFELHVLNGMKRVLREKPPRHIFCEVHFTQLDKMGLRSASNDIVRLLSDYRYKIKWTDTSHIHAYL